MTIDPTSDAGDDEPAVVQTRNVVFDAPPHEVWPWLAQMGHGRAGWYSLDVVERLIGAARSVDGWRSIGRVEPSLATVSTGDHIPMGRGLDLEVVQAREPEVLALVFDNDVLGGHLRMDWQFALQPVVRHEGVDVVHPPSAGPLRGTASSLPDAARMHPDDPDAPSEVGTLLQVRTVIRATPTPLRVAVTGLLGPGHRIMEAAQLRGLRTRVEG
jgi:hypothetical protein